ncbi:Trypanosomal VSG domain containing protein [Trypanosoma brucei equiperdum]|uniref:Trypanosomal VSG domain containing protein n=1 Tax=Trypanosoma brucei equiperdum TaxID=630700 RepID=A0A3L6L629_9TRYP|nr:Trypanosomal VSG domain containing protein [Trypanosoma brucei equiperdum]RHW72134.1 Trypanosomal VSG domain containing protein [Trypanosoma brucei equiperdum]RHW72170.1 Trypanosomal VSG domain containing protein [Trypanosoma brucei equiperdum]RHW72289.1 Trypanosomal VSG domain containing protein [Trypanosoma brucei equiperdum]
MAAWAELKAKYNSRRTGVGATPEAIQSSLAAFITILGKGVAGGAGSKLKVGNGAADNSCDGSGSAQTCIHYSGIVTTDDLKKIPWVSQMQLAATKLKSVETKRADLESKRHELWETKGQALEAANQLTLTIATAPIDITPQEIKETEETCEAKGVGDKCTPPCKVVEEEGGEKKCKLNPDEVKKQENQEGKDRQDAKTESK